MSNYQELLNHVDSQCNREDADEVRDLIDQLVESPSLLSQQSRQTFIVEHRDFHAVDLYVVEAHSADEAKVNFLELIRNEYGFVHIPNVRVLEGIPYLGQPDVKIIGCFYVR